MKVALVFVISYHRAHVWMTQPVHDANLVSQLLERAAAGKLLCDGFDGHAFAGDAAHRAMHRAERPAAESLPEHVVVLNAQVEE